MKKIVLIVLSFYYTCAIAQESAESPALETHYYNTDGIPVSTKDSCDYYITWFEELGRWNSLNRAFYATDTLKEEGYYKAYRKVGTWREWYRHGQLKSEIDYGIETDDTKRKAFPDMLNYWNEEGEQLVMEGHGYFVEIDKKSGVKEEGAYVNGQRDGEWRFHNGDTLRHREVWEGDSVTGYTFLREAEKADYDGQDSVFYEQLLINATPQGGMQEFYRYISRSINYPETAKRAGYQGRVVVQFIINEQGQVTEMKCARGVMPALDAEAMRVVEIGPLWSPAIQRGRRVKQKMSLPISFKLD